MTFDELKNFTADFGGRVARLGEFLKIAEKSAKQGEIEAKMSAPDFWDNKEEAQQLMAELTSCRNLVNPYKKLTAEAEDLNAMLELAQEDPSLLSEADATRDRLERELSEIEMISFLSGKFDHNDSYVSIHAGAGGTESCDWTGMLLRMYRRYFERRGWKDEVVDMQPGEEAGIKSVTLHVSGEFAYGCMRSERGVHRLVRISPFDSNARRHTSFASVEAFPDFEDDCEIEIEEKDLRTNAETGNTSAVLDGDIEMFIEAYLRDPSLNGQ